MSTSSAAFARTANTKLAKTRGHTEVKAHFVFAVRGFYIETDAQAVGDAHLFL